MRTLFIDTSSSDVSIAIVENEKIISKIIKNIPNQHSIYAVKFVNDVLENAQIDAKDIDNIMVVNGPGSFTCIRIGLTIAKIYGYLLKKDIITVSSLRAMALSSDAKIVIPVIDAHHDNYYYGVYDMFDNIILKDNFNNKDELLKQISKYEDADIVSNEEFDNGDIKARKIEYDIVNIINHYKYELPSNPHFIVPNYLKLPQALEGKHD